MSATNPTNYSVVRARIFDFEVTAPGRSLVGFRYKHGETFGSGQYFFMAKRADPFILDCGSNIGISIHINSNALSEVQVHRAALGSEDLTVDFYWDPDALDSGHMSTIREGVRKGGGPEGQKLWSSR
jgi:hypothetical protein